MSDALPTFFEENPGELIREHRRYYLMVNAIARRVRQLQTGDRALSLPADNNRDPLHIAIQEFLDDKLEIVPKQVLPLMASEEGIMLEQSGDIDVGSHFDAAFGTHGGDDEGEDL